MTSTRSQRPGSEESESTAARKARVAAWKAALEQRPRGALFCIGVRAPAASPGSPGAGNGPGSPGAGDGPSGPGQGQVARREPCLIEGVPRGHDEDGLRLAVPGVKTLFIRWDDISSLRLLRQEETDDETHRQDQVDRPRKTTGGAVDSGG